MKVQAGEFKGWDVGGRSDATRKTPMPTHRGPNDKWWLAGVAAFAVVGVGAIAAYPSHTPPLPSPYVIVTTDAGHGSATHIGNGLYVTAAHVAAVGATINGQPATVLWSNADYDIALMSGPVAFQSIPLACVVPSEGSTGEAHGNPMQFTNITMTGRVAGVVQSLGHWLAVVPVDVSMAPGMSGGGFIQDGQLTGVNVGVAMMPAGLGASLFGLSFIVPAKVVCSLMGR